MAITKEDQNTFLMIFAILIVCLIAIIAIFSGIWAIIREPVNNLLNNFGILIYTNQVYDYNFVVATSGTIEEETSELEEVVEDNKTSEIPEINYNFQIPGGSYSFKVYPDAVLDDEELNKLEAGEITQPAMELNIPSINLKSPVLQGRNSDELLKLGFWLSPGSYTLGEGEVLFFCHRTYFGPNDAKSCWFLDKVKADDEITIVYSNETLTYRVTGINVFDSGDPVVTHINSKEDFIRIVTFTPRDSSAQRLVVLAKRVN